MRATILLLLQEGMYFCLLVSVQENSTVNKLTCTHTQINQSCYLQGFQGSRAGLGGQEVLRSPARGKPLEHCETVLISFSRTTALAQTACACWEESRLDRPGTSQLPSKAQCGGIEHDSAGVHMGSGLTLTLALREISDWKISKKRLMGSSSVA